MDSSHQTNGQKSFEILGLATLMAALTIIGCASPGPPRAPSLNLPQPVRDLAVTRTGNQVELHFTAPSNSTDKLPLRGPIVIGQLCRQLDTAPCLPVPTSKATIPILSPTGTHNLITWTDPLPPDLTQGPPKLLTYRVEFFSPTNRSAGPSNPAVTVAGPPPPPVENLQAEGSRLGVILNWNPSTQPEEVLLKRENLAPKPLPQPKPTPPIIWLATNTTTPRTLDTTALPDTPYRYTAQRRATVQIGNRSIQLLSALSDPLTFTLHEVYPPLPPTGLTAVSFFGRPPLPDVEPPFAVDLIWQPVDDAGLTAGLAGYNVYREAIDPTLDPRDKLNPTPLPTPAFHDTTADPTLRYRYSVTAVDTKANESPAATVILEPYSKH